MREVIEDDEGSSSESSIGLGGGRSDPELELLFPGEKIGVRKERKGKRRNEREGLLRKGELSHSSSSFLDQANEMGFVITDSMITESDSDTSLDTDQDLRRSRSHV